MKKKLLIVLVLLISFSNAFSNIQIIQAGSGKANEWCVLKGDFTTANYGYHPNTKFQLRRLKTN